LRVHQAAEVFIVLSLAQRLFAKTCSEALARMSRFLVAALVSSVAAIELTSDNWDEQVKGKTVFIKFLAPW
jgi:hypothetical protein